ncbi:hypothetical protein NEHOM01_1029 [Nematocida homosporus]|uniref:uncharacterized protein n=1 Tax=Nematocida homosporus TaxID=1912981 RepID=UPI00221F9F69|nr:uncharacterized protein NEHOM01_1029 [Nematocida homosporus]KAI5185737.1 hypothetical protein NEHOM01_1029 [Nematocida homosporus]
MEKYSNFCDPTTGINPYTRDIKRHITLLSLFTTPILVTVLMHLPRFLWQLFTGGLLTITPSPSLAKARTRGVSVFACTYTSLFDTHALFALFKHPRIYLLTTTATYTVSRFNVLTKTPMPRLESATPEAPIILFLSGGLTNGRILLDTPTRSMSYLSLTHTPPPTDINLFSQVTPQFYSLLPALAYHFVYCAIFKNPRVVPKWAETLPDLADITGLDIAKGFTNETTAQFLSRLRQ